MRCGGGEVYTNPQPAAAEHVVLRAQRRLPQQHAWRRPLQVCPGAWTDGRAHEARRSSSSAQQQSHASARTRETRSRVRARTAGPATTGAADPTAGTPRRAVIVRARLRTAHGRTTTEAGTGR
ncbi:MAG: hypothetical protein ACPIOQ_63155, partial [Promethearchaeia archaeon]